jgi:hypothetical protein
MGATVSSYDELKKKVIEKNTPKEVCPPDEVFAIKKNRIEAIRQLINIEWESIKNNPNQVEFHILIDDRIRYIDNNYKLIYIKGYYVRVPEKYKNGLDIIVDYYDVINIIKSIIIAPHIIRYENGHIFRIYIVQNI